MAVETIVTDLTLRLVLNAGLDKNGKTVFKNKQLKQVKPNADLEKVHDVARALSSLQELKLHAVQVVSTTDLSNL
ncbi:DUF1659 domain-containing protein [Bacillus cytotoxicus]|uniref:DUF1659 domain-containing protein n=1 Tax=Bacillus cytotoxicus (strain DSM 22905 / CIP 110041 / 391-98 / NVH 391-98) TaxID=315749 RepID=A7GV11_BACCN|nr:MULTISPECIES: DUF1659 domain-containing protein [Bacillus cereus group]ABS23969.1 protein of unknown function DUF1659 [Bacillus cytotoxicus NVH 391-98]AWC30536.1 DUF1659 domain-containing protein [Bacillus cytotoxicus]AWC34591.1 DUF1659 domain-containing protein [Bacillus cytotoxicus]AWC38589.1 DUF1659 domain-containing protein [Bacillus cytotoxicus]AWC42679.1 DUF1659 domain-containing protein [Bacillus cytotoxicus]